MPRNAKDDADRIIAKMERAANALERVGRKDRGGQGQSPVEHASKPGFNIGGAMTKMDIGSSAYKAYQGVERGYNVTKLGAMAGEAVGKKMEPTFGKMPGLLAHQTGNALQIGTGIASMTPMGWGSAAMAAGDTVKTQFNIGKEAGEIGRERFRQFGHGVSNIGRAFGPGEGGRPYKRGEASMLDVSRGAENFGRMVGGPIGGAAANMVTPSEWMLKSTAELRDFSNKLHDTNMQFSEFSGGMMSVKVNQQIRDMGLSQQRGDRRAASAEYNASGKNELDQTFAKVEDFFAVAKGFAAGGMSRIANYFLEPFSKPFELLTEAMNDMAKKLGITEDNDHDNENDMMEAVRMHERPERFGGPQRKD